MALITCLKLSIFNPKNLYTRGNNPTPIEQLDIAEPEKATQCIKYGEQYYDTELSISRLTIDRGIGKHCLAEAKMMFTVLKYNRENKSPALSCVVNCFDNCRAEIYACTYDDGKTVKGDQDMQTNGASPAVQFNVAKNYYVIDNTMECEVLATNGDGYVMIVNLTLKLASWDYFLDRNPYSKVYLNKQLGAEVMKQMVDGHKRGWEIETKGIQNIYYEKKDEREPNKIIRQELHQPYLVQFNETEYQFLLRNANRCGEFLFFESGKLKYGLSCNEDGHPFVRTSLDRYDSVKSVCENTSLDMSSEYFLHNGCNYGDIRQISAVKKERPFVAEYANDEYFRPIKKDDYDSYYEQFAATENFDVTGINTKGRYIGEKWKHYSWKMVNIVLAHQDSIGKIVEDCISLGTDAIGFPQRRAANDNNNSYKENYFKEGRVNSAKAQYSDKDDFHSQFSELYTDETLSNKYGDTVGNRANKAGYTVKLASRPSTDLFFRMAENEKKVASRRYILTYNDLVNVLLGDILDLPSISKEKFVVVDVQSESGIKEQTRTNKTIVTVVPAFKETTETFYPLPAGVEFFRKSGSQTAYVVDNADPLFQGRVRIKYPWQKDPDKVEDASPWIRVTYPYATKGSGIYSKLTVGDEVMVNYVNDNIELPFVSGSLYGMENRVPFNARGYSQVIRSSNGHMIGVTEGNTTVNLWKGMLPVLPLFNFIFKKVGIDKPESDNFFKKLIGGVVIRDTYGFYQIKASSDERKISISSPYGDVTIDAFTGITLSAPNGDINIKGKNVNIVANNNLTLKSGENIENALFTNKRKDDSLLPTINKLGAKVVEAVASKFLDMSYIRSIFETFLRPVDGTLEIKSNRYLILNSGNGNAAIPISAYASVTDVEECEKKLYNDINAMTFWRRDCADVLANYYHHLYEVRMNVMNDFIYWRDSLRFITDKHLEFANQVLKNNGDPKDDDALELIIDDYITSKPLVEIPDNMPNTIKRLENLKTEYTAFWGVTEDTGWYKEMKKDNEKKAKFYRELAAIILNQGDNNQKLFKKKARGLMLKPDLLKRKTENDVADFMRKKVAAKVKGKLAGASKANWNDKVKELIEKLQQDVTEAKREVDGYIPFDKAILKSFNEKETIRYWKSCDARKSWQQDTMGQILIAQDKGKTLSFNGAEVQETSNSYVEQMRELLLSPTFTCDIPGVIIPGNNNIDENVIEDLSTSIIGKVKNKEEVKEALSKIDISQDKNVEDSIIIIDNLINPK